MNDNIISDRIKRPLLYSLFQARVQLQGIKALSLADRVLIIRTDFEYFLRRVGFQETAPYIVNIKNTGLKYYFINIYFCESSNSFNLQKLK